MLSVRGFLDAYGSQTTDFQFRAKSVVLEHIGQHATHKTVFVSHKTADYSEAEERVGKALSKQGLAVYFVEDDSSVLSRGPGRIAWGNQNGHAKVQCAVGLCVRETRQFRLFLDML